VNDGLAAFVQKHFAPGRLYTFVGAGGKTSGMKSVADLLRRRGVRVRLATTTRVGVDELAGCPTAAVSTAAELAACLASREAILLLAGGTDGDGGKYLGLAPSLLEAAVIPPDLVVLVEGDGSRRLPLKAPTEREPVIPTTTATVFALMGASGFGETIDEAHCYNSAGALAVLGRAEGVFDARALARLAADPRGGRKGVLPGTEFHLVVNQGDLAEKRETALALLGLLAREHGISATLLSWREGTVYG
jgi:probable selenium-dependent hydroxylase accessory protein YqeC